MLRRLRTLAITLSLTLATFFVLGTQPVFAWNPFSSVCQAANGTGNNSTACQTNANSNPIGGTNGILFKVSLILSIIAAIGAVVVIIISGLSYVTSAGDSQKATKARHAIISAVIGLVVIALAQGLITLVINIVQ